MRKRVENFYLSHKSEIIVFLIAVPYLVIQVLHGGDFRILLRGAEYLCKGVSPYGIIMPIDGEVTDVFLYSPFVGFVLMPLTYLPEFLPTFTFALINLFMLFRIWRITGAWLKIGAMNDRQRKWWFMLSIGLTMRFILHNFEKTQMNIVVFYLTLEGLYQIFISGRQTGGLLLSLGICIKILPLIFLPYILFKRKFTSLGLSVLGCVLLLSLPAIWFGPQFNLELLRGWWSAINPTIDKYNSQQNVGVYFHCISALIPVYFSNSSYNGLSVNFMSLDKSQLFFVINFVRLILVAFAAYFFMQTVKDKKQSGFSLFWEQAYIFLLIPLIFPHQQKYSYINLLPAFGYIVYYLVSVYPLGSANAKRDKALLLISLAVITLPLILTADIFWGMSIGKYFQFMKMVTIGTILLIPVLAIFSPNRLNSVLKGQPDI